MSISIYTEFDYIAGPYIRKDDGRKYISLIGKKDKNNIKGKYTTILLSRAIMITHLGRRLIRGETVDHIDRIKTNDVIENLQILTRSEHASIDALRVKVEQIKCPICNKEFTPNRNQRITRYKGKAKAGPFCSKKCAGIYGTNIQNNKTPRLNRLHVNRTYYRLEK